MFLRVTLLHSLIKNLTNQNGDNKYLSKTKRNYTSQISQKLQQIPLYLQAKNKMNNQPNKDSFYRLVENELWLLYKHFPVNIIDKLDDISCAKFVYDNIKQKQATTSIFANSTDITVENIQSRVLQIKNYRNQLINLMNIPQVKQRTPEWYDMRKERLTASATAQAIGKGKFGNRNQLLQSKAFPDLEKWFPTTSGPMYHGTMLEEMTARCYSQRNNDMKMYDFGMIKHPNLDCYGASPDGITELGIMIEIKTPYRREVNGYIPEEYYLQMQGQMAACGLLECDFVDCKIDIVPSENMYSSQIKPDINVDHGIIVEDRDDNGNPKFVYSPPYLNTSECIKWKNDLIATERAKFKYIKVTYWKLYKIIATRVYFEEELWNSLVPQIETFWKDVLTLRANAPPVTSSAVDVNTLQNNKTHADKKPKYDFIDSDDD